MVVLISTEQKYFTLTIFAIFGGCHRFEVVQ
jgi:hypothetical protein